MTFFERTLPIAALACLIAAPQARALVLPEMGEMTPHRAVYEIRLGRATSAAGVISPISGRTSARACGAPMQQASAAIGRVLWKKVIWRPFW